MAIGLGAFLASPAMQSACTLLNRALRDLKAVYCTLVGRVRTRTPAELDRRIEQLQALRQRRLALDRERERKRDTRRKVIIGGGLLALIRRGDQAAAEVGRKILQGASERDRTLVAAVLEGEQRR